MEFGEVKSALKLSRDVHETTLVSIRLLCFSLCPSYFFRKSSCFAPRCSWFLGENWHFQIRIFKFALIWRFFVLCQLTLHALLEDIGHFKFALVLPRQIFVQEYSVTGMKLRKQIFSHKRMKGNCRKPNICQLRSDGQVWEPVVGL